eukprot:9411289-Pyramimonas_sp.AAC.1
MGREGHKGYKGHGLAWRGGSVLRASRWCTSIGLKRTESSGARPMSSPYCIRCRTRSTFKATSSSCSSVIWNQFSELSLDSSTGLRRARATRQRSVDGTWQHRC